MYYKIKKPDLNRINKEDLSEKMVREKREEIIKFVKRANEPEYLHWEKVKYKKPVPKDFKLEFLWMFIKLFRDSLSTSAVIKDENGKMFKWVKLPSYEEFFHLIDLHTGGKLVISKIVNIKDKEKFISRGIMEEAIASSQLEGASTSRRVAKKMIQEGRKPRSKSEQMIMNNYKSMRAVEDEYKEKSLSYSLLLEMHAMITKDTKDDKGETPRLRKRGEKIYVTDKISGIIYHEAPDIDFVKKEIKRLVKFANDELGNDNFIHPIIKAMMLHFWAGYLHPFTDGNGRLARLLFYWYLLKNDYWAFAYLPISAAIKKAPMQYTMAFVYSEQDDNDMTYFINYHIKKVKEAIVEFKDYYTNKSKENIAMKKLAKTKYKFNERQIQVLQYFCGAPEERTNMKTHINIFQVAKMTAIKDLKILEQLGFLNAEKEGRHVYYYPAEKIKELFK